MGTVLLDCPWCGATNSTFIVTASGTTPQMAGLPGERIQVNDAFAKCGHCPRYVLLQLYSRELGRLLDPVTVSGDIAEALWFVRTIHPGLKTATSPTHVPAQAADKYVEAVKSLNAGIWSGAGILARASVELALAAKQEVTEISNLKKALAALRSSGDVPGYVADWGEHVRVLGNDAAHRKSFDKTEAHAAVAFAKELLLTLFTRPQEIAETRARYEAKKTIEKMAE